MVKKTRLKKLWIQKPVFKKKDRAPGRKPNVKSYDYAQYIILFNPPDALSSAEGPK